MVIQQAKRVQTIQLWYQIMLTCVACLLPLLSLTSTFIIRSPSEQSNDAEMSKKVILLKTNFQTPPFTQIQVVSVICN